MREWVTAAVMLGCLQAAEPLWIEGEAAAESNVVKHPWYHGQVKTGDLSGGDFLSHFSPEKEGDASYTFEIKEAGNYELWIRANPVQSQMTLKLDDGAEEKVDFNRRQTGTTNIASDNKPDLRFLAWSQIGTYPLTKGRHRLGFRFTSANSHHGAIDCLVLALPGFQPMGVLKPDEIAHHQQDLRRENQGWTPWLPDAGAKGALLLDMRPLNERFAGEKGGVVAKGGNFVFRNGGERVRFWGVNGPPENLRGEELADCARSLAAHGVNLVRLHGKVFDESTGELDPKRIARIREVVAAMKKEGIYSHLSVYFPLWMKPKPGPGWREGYDGDNHPFALLFFEPEFQKLHRGWIEAVLGKTGGLLDDPAVFGLELVNEDSFFFWTFDEKNIPDPQLRKLEKRFADWAAAKYGSTEQAITAWGGMRLRRDVEGRLGFRPLYQISHERRPRDQDTAAFLLEVQRGFYADTTAWLRKLGFKGLVTASNWQTADEAILGPLEKYSYTACDFIDRHGYFGCSQEGDNAAWSIRDGHVYRDRSALRFEPEEPGAPMSFSNPVIDPEYNGLPSMISETTFNRPNRFRTEAPWLYAAYGALQDSDAIIHFALDSGNWAVKPGIFMQPWTLMSPTQGGQFPAAAFLFRQGLIHEGKVVANASLSLSDALALKGCPIAPGANLDALRKADLDPRASDTSRGIDPLAYFTGRTRVSIGKAQTHLDISSSNGIERSAKRLTSTTGELQLDYARGTLLLRAPLAQGAVGSLAKGSLDLPDLSIQSPLELGAIVAVSLDGRPLTESKRILLQAMSEEKATGFATEPMKDGRKRITAIGQDPWLIRNLAGEVCFKRIDAAKLHVQHLDRDGRLIDSTMGTAPFILSATSPYYLITAD